MGHKVFISPSDQTKNTYAYGNTNEAEQCGRVGQALKTALERCGFEVMLLQYATMAEKCAASDKFGAELHLPVHSNGFNGQVAGTRMMCMNFTGNGYKACKAIFNKLAPITPGTSEGISAQPQLYEIRVPSAPTAYVEIDFHDVESVAKWIIENTEKIAESIAEGICDYFGVNYVSGKVENVNETDGKEKEEMRYKTLRDLKSDKNNSKYYLPTIKKLMNKGILNGKGGTGDDTIIDLGEDSVRLLVMLDRAKVFGD